MNPHLLLFLLSSPAGGAGSGPVFGMNYSTYFGRVGKGVYLMNLVNQFRGATGSYLPTNLPTRWKNFVTQFDGEQPNIRATISDSVSQLDSAIDGMGVMTAAVQQWIVNLTIEMTDDVSRLSALTLSTAVAALIDEMLADGKSLNANTVAISASPGGGNDGNGPFVVSLLDGSGLTLEYAYDEELAVRFTNASSSGSERAQILGTVAADGLLSQNWPLGSASNTSLTSLDATSGSNLIANGGFETLAAANTPSGWSIDVGGIGTQIKSEAVHFYKGALALAMVGDGTNLTAISQPLTNLVSKTPYAINLFAQMSAAPSQGVLTVDLFDGTSIITDESGRANSFTINLTTLGTAYIAKNHVFCLSEPLPDTVTLRVHLTTALQAAKTLYIDHLAMGAMQQLYNGGPFVLLFSGSEDWSLDDTWTLTVTNDYAGQMQTALWRIFNMPDLGFIFPSKSDGSENISDTFIA